MSGGGLRPGIRRVNVRWDAQMSEMQLRCEDCSKGGRTQSYWPATLEFWYPRLGLQRCRACHNDRRRAVRRTKMDAAAKQRAYYAANRTHRLEWVHSYRDKNRERINALRRAAYARKVAAKREVEG